MIDKDRSIVTQVAAKIAADLTPKGEATDKLVSDFAFIFESVKDMLLEACLPTMAGQTIRAGSAIDALQNTFGDVEQIAPTSGELTVVGRQHGELPGWLIEACKRDGVTRIYDNRDSLKDNPKRPWFKAVDDKEKAYWPPRGK